MCGIVGYLGHEPASGHILTGLRALEYRGYDSAGLAVLGPDGVSVRRRAGRLHDLEALVEAQPVEGTMGIGHTRWATHGAATDANAHPHRDRSGRVVIVHNGITDNFADLRDGLLASGHAFTSETDTEVIAHLIGLELDAGADLASAVGAAVQQLEGAHAIVALSPDVPDVLVAARRGAAGGLVVGRNGEASCIASDLVAVIRHTHRVQVLEADEMAVVHADRAAQITDLRLRPRTRAMIDIPWDPLSIAKAGHKHFLAKEIHEQPTTLASVIRPRITLDPIELRFPSFRLPMPAAEIERVVLVGSGTAWHAGLIGRDYIEDFAGLPATCEIASEFAYRAGPLSPRTLVVAITQSGETADVLAAIGRAKRGGATVVGIVNVVGSEATRQAGAVMYMHAGPEVSVAATKTFTSQLASLHLLACQLGVARGVLSQQELRHHLAALAHVPEHVERALTCEPQIEALARRFHRYRDFLYIGRGQAFPLALEGALKLKEISYIHAEGYAAGELKHGPIALAAADVPVVAVATAGPLRDKTLNAVEQVRARGAPVILIATEGDEQAGATADEVVYVPKTAEAVAPIVTAIPLQLLAYHVAVWLGADIDQPRNLAKSVTVE
ncbi:MAG: glutamine--fructose-6-phosphate transaminase (isomerizing) [Chloroflexi bacterium]|nr:glutamine--fructose-6-phosphate transaminase (isomerizing) [Chloroflexota bacterium]